MYTAYDAQADPVIQALIAEAKADPAVIGLVLSGSRAVGAVAPESDYDLLFVVTDAAFEHYTQTNTMPVRGATIVPPIDTTDIWNTAPCELQVARVVAWMLPAYAEAQVLYDRTGETTRVINALRQLPAAQARAAVARWYDAYLNGLYRSLKAWRRGNVLGGRLEAAQTADYLLHLLFGLEGQWRPYSSRLCFHLDKLAAQGWQAGEVSDVLLDLISTGDPRRQQAVARRVIALLQTRGFAHVYDAWEGKIDEVLRWDFA